MTAILLGRAPQGNFIVSDAIVSHPSQGKTKIYLSLSDKISRLFSCNYYCSLVGDMKVLDGINCLDDWYFIKNKISDFSKVETMKNALIAAEKYRTLWIAEGSELQPEDVATVYFVGQKRIFEYEIILKANKYQIERFRSFPEGEVVLNYGSDIETITNFNYPSKQVFVAAKKYIESFHKNAKRKAKRNPAINYLKYDFDNRFCGVVFTKDISKRPLLYSPFNKLSEAIASEANDLQVMWKLIDDKKFSWSPEDEDKHVRRK